MFTLQKLSNYGTSTPAVARTALQGCDILQFLGRPDSEKEAAKVLLFELQRHLVKCVEIKDTLEKEVAAGHAEVAANGLKFQSGGRAVTLPSVGELQSKAESFLQSAKLAIAATGNLIQPFYGVGNGHKYQKVSAWAEKEFGAADQFVIVLKSWEPFVSCIVQMRNCVDHPETEPGAPLLTANFSLKQVGTTFELIEPSWGLTGESLQPMVADFDKIIEETIRLGEDVLVGLFYKLRASPIVGIEEIPQAQRDPANPRRLNVGFHS